MHPPVTASMGGSVAKKTVLTQTLHTTTNLITPLVLTLLAYGVYKTSVFIWEEYLFSPLKNLPGPQNPSFLYGHMKEIMGRDGLSTYEKWVGKFGNTFKYKSLFGMSRIYTTDLKAINHIMMNTQTYHPPVSTRSFFQAFLGNGILSAVDDQHREQRKIMNPAFGPSQIRDLTEIFVEKSLELRDVWMKEINEGSQGKKLPSETSSGRVDILPGLGKMTLDVIGLAGFHYKFDTLAGKKNELDESLRAIFNDTKGRRLPIMMLLIDLFGKVATLIPYEEKITQARALMDKLGWKLLEESKAALLEDGGRNMKDNFKNRDLLSLLVKANTDPSLLESQRMNDKTVIAQIPTFLSAGHETTSTATTWALYELSIDENVQTKLREELYTIATENPTMDELNSLQYLEFIVRETLRLHPPLHSAAKVAVKDDVLPLEKPFVDNNGGIKTSMVIRSGQPITIPISVVNRSEEHWGPDANEFQPDRWKSVPEGAGKIPGLWANLLTFLGGPRACIGYRFSLVEIKALLFTLVRAFEFELAVDVQEIGTMPGPVQRPMLLNDPENSVQMPMIVKPYVHTD